MNDSDRIGARVTAHFESKYFNHQRYVRTWRWSERHPAVVRRFVRSVINVLASSDIAKGVELGEGVVLMHKGLGVVMNEDVRVIAPSIVFHQVTLGHAWDETEEAPLIGPYALVSAGATVLGGVRVGPFSVVAAGAVVLVDVPALSIASGIPATIRPADRSDLERWFAVTSEEIDVIVAAPGER